MPVTSDDDVEELVAGRSVVPARLQAYVTGPSGRRLAVALLCLALLAGVVAGVVQWHRHTERVAAAHRAAVAAQRAAHRRAQAHRRHNALDLVDSWAADDTPFGIATLSSSRTPGCRDVDGQAADPPQIRVSHELLAAFPTFTPRALSRTIDESGRLCALLVSVSDGRAVVVLRADPMLRRTVTQRSAAGLRDGDSVGYVAVDSPGRWTTVIGWRGPAGYAPDPSIVQNLADREATNW